VHNYRTSLLFAQVTSGVSAVVWECCEGQTHRQTDTDDRDQYTFRLGYASREMQLVHGGAESGRPLVTGESKKCHYTLARKFAFADRFSRQDSFTFRRSSKHGITSTLLKISLFLKQAAVKLTCEISDNFSTESGSDFFSPSCRQFNSNVYVCTYVPTCAFFALQLNLVAHLQLRSKSIM